MSTNIHNINKFNFMFLQEGITCDFEFLTSSPAAMVSLIDKPAQQNLVNI
jgi:hypothetical protein